MLFAPSRVPSRSIRVPLPLQTASLCTRPTRSRLAKSFARKRIHHAIELMGACIMMATFVLLSLFL
jgi:hypothetical protein